MNKYPESDWKELRKLEPELLNKLFKRNLQLIDQLINDQSKSPKERYHGLHPLIEKSNREIDESFDMRRSNMLFVAVGWIRLGLISIDDLDSFSDEFRDSVTRYLKLS